MSLSSASGTWQYGGEWGMDFTQPEVNAILDKARELGVNLIDTAECYGDHTSEAFIGNAINRDRGNWIVATKFGHVFHGPFKPHRRTVGERCPQAGRSIAESIAD